MYIFATKTKFLDSYDTVILSGNCLDVLRNIKQAKKIYYCHTPPRYLFDKYEYYLSQKKWIKKILFQLIVPILRNRYIKNLWLLDKIIVNSKYVKERLKSFTWYDSEVVYPPVDTSKFIPWESKWYYLSYSRLTDIKRVDMIAKAFIKMPNKKLIINYNPSDPYLNAVQEIIKWHNNIQLFRAWDDIEKLVSECIASIYIPKDEDFGMIPVESMSAWKPVIWVNEWWLKESIIDWKTWILLDPDFEINDICDAVNELNQETCNKMSEDCIKRSKDFELWIFIEKMKEVINY